MTAMRIANEIHGSIDSGRIQDVLVPFGVTASEWGDPNGRLTGKFELAGPIDRLSGPLDISVNPYV